MKKFVYASSSSVYGDEPNLPKREGIEGNLLSPYAVSKRCNEEWAKQYTKHYGLDTYGMRYFNVFGRRQDPDGAYAAVIPKFIKQLLNGQVCRINGDGKQSRDFTYVENRGVAFGMFSDMRWFFVAVTAVLIAIIIYIMFKKKPSGKMFYISAALIIGGGIGNLIDRIFYGFVVDYISVSFFPPVCNFADYCITVGTILLIVYVLFFSNVMKSEKKVNKSNE